MIRNERKLLYIGTLIVALSGVFTGMHVSAETLPDQTYVGSLENKYIGIGVGKQNSVFLTANATSYGILRPDSATHNVGSGTPPMAGRFYMWTTGGDPTISADDNQALTYTPLTVPTIAMPVGRAATWQIMTDDRAGSWDTYSYGGSAAVWGEQSDGVWTKPLTADPIGNEITGEFEPWPLASSMVRCGLNAKLLRDTVRWKWTITNYDSVVRMVGLRLCIDEMMEPNDLGTVDAANTIRTNSGEYIVKPTVLSDLDIPSELELFNSTKNPIMGFREMFSGQGATAPDRVGIDNWSNLIDLGSTIDPSNPMYTLANPWTYGWDYLTGGYNSWLYVTPVEKNISTDVATGAFWKPVPIGPGASLTIIHYTGLACASSNFTTPSIDRTRYVGATQSPRTLKYVTENGVGGLYPAKFNITAYVDNVGTTPGFDDLTNVTATLVLPEGIQLDASENGQLTKVMAPVGVGEEQSVSWSVVPSSTVSGPVKYFVTFNADPVGGSSVSREIYFPATEKQPISNGWQMVTVPFNISTLDTIGALGLNGYASSIWKWNASTSSYQAVDKPVPGEGYWIMMNVPKTTSITSTHTAVDWSSTSTSKIALNRGWNMIGDPYLYSTNIGQTKFYNSETGAMVDYDTAVSSGLISPYTWSWNSGTGKYDLWSNGKAPLNPWKGYWLKVLQPGITLIFDNVNQIGAQIGVGSDDGGIPDPPSGGDDNPPSPP